MLQLIIFICALFCTVIFFHQIVTMCINFIGYNMRTFEERKQFPPFKDKASRARQIMAFLLSLFWGIFYYLTH